MRKIKLVFSVVIITFLLSLLGGAFVSPARAARLSEEPPEIAIYFFWGEGCPHCADEKPFLADLSARYPQVKVFDFEVWHDDENRDLFTALATAFGSEPQGVPTTFIGDREWVGFSAQIEADIEAYVEANLEVGVVDRGAGIVPGREAVSTPAPESSGSAVSAPTAKTITIPFIGEINLANQSLAISTALIAFVDGFNPCSLWVLSMLLALTLHTGSRKKVLIIGLVFITVTSGVYVLFIAGLFTVLTFVDFMGFIQVAVSLMALFFAVVNIKDYFWYKEGLSFTIADEKKPGIYKGIRKVMKAGDSLWGLISATFVMSAGVSLVEFSCTAGFPVLWTNLVAAQEVQPWAFVGLLLLYMVIYQIDEMGIFLVAVFTLQATRLEEKQGRLLKLLGGMLMLTLALVMLIRPSIMSELSSALLVFGLAFGAALLVLLVHRVILPRFGVLIGSELKS